MSKRKGRKVNASGDPFVTTVPPLDLRSFITAFHTPFHGCDAADDFKVEYLCAEILSKYQDGTTDSDELAAAALQRLEESEQMCKESNNTDLIAPQGGYVYVSRHVRRPRQLDYTSQWMSAVLFHAQARASEILGPVNFDWVEKCKLTNGASLGHKKRDAYPVAKLKGDFFVTPKAKPYMDAFIGSVNRRIFQAVKIRLALGNRVATVPKNNKTDRVIAIEPEGNVLLQKGMGTWLKGRLKEFGVDLYDQQRNRDLASHLCNATIDLSMASDTISQRIVLEVLPLEWYDLLDSLRSHYGQMPDGSWRRWEKFSSMGNGFTFELETLLFHCLAYGVSHVELGSYRKGDFATYGDDIICPVAMASSLIHALHVCGFKPNPSKTFISGPFRESCGVHYFEGVDVSPFYIRKPVDSIPRLIWLGNTIRSWAAVTDDYADCRAFAAWNAIADQIPRSLHGGRNLQSQSALVSPLRPKSNLSIKRGAPWEGRGYRAVAAWMLQAPSSGRTFDDLNYGTSSQGTTAMDEFIASLEWVYSGLTPWQIRHLMHDRSSVGPPVVEIGYELTDAFENLCPAQIAELVGYALPRFGAEQVSTY